ncbi:MAG: UDP-N-acetylmuramoyl-tripeptide--D-alanyl-D-alanine ligase [Deltaproteobacteria bacterium]|jgi:UDP-N-acetylmuramoyl-tripeptide--D-alanyl-D-alanine ligase|nr:UDP-N-acetylmuramoyl-tripeptide--D-alanyl-D-alanine ligase [Deltaproteobacteria bacterium]
MAAGELKSGPGFRGLKLELAVVAGFLGTVAECTDLSINWEAKVLGVTTDSRRAGPGELFVALKGEKFDGHDFVGRAFEAGAMAAVVAEGFQVKPKCGPLIRVKDTQVAFGNLARQVRRLVNPKVVAVTGSVGKTTVKDLLSSIFEQASGKGELKPSGQTNLTDCGRLDQADDSNGPKVLSSYGNFNNHVGLPLTLLAMGPQTKLAVVELGANHHGEIADLTSICEPDVGIVTAIGEAHLEFFGDLEKVAQAKGELYRGLKPSAAAVVNIEEPLLKNQAEGFGGRKIFFGSRGTGADVEVEKIKDLGFGGQRLAFSGALLGQRAPTVDLALFGDHNTLNAAAAAATALAAGINWEDIVGGLAKAKPAPGRINPAISPSGIWVLDDTYNANPTSTAAGLKFIGQLESAKGAVLGDMMELGDQAEQFHCEIGELAFNNGLDRLAVVGPLARLAGEAAQKAGMPGQRVAFFDDPHSAALWMAGQLGAGSAVLIKGSRAMAMEQAVAVFFSNQNLGPWADGQRNG